MDMQHGRVVPVLVSAVVGAVLFGAYVAVTRLDADVAHSPLLLAMAIAVFVIPGCASALVMELRARRAAPAVFAPRIDIPFPAAEAVADILSLTEARVERSVREQRAQVRTARKPLAVS
jgi:hypothetical protein